MRQRTTWQASGCWPWQWPSGCCQAQGQDVIFTNPSRRSRYHESLSQIGGPSVGKLAARERGRGIGAGVGLGRGGRHTREAAGVVSTCDEASLTTALAGGGTVTFSCSGTITLTSTKTIASNTTLDGAGQSVTISGNNAVRVFIVNPGVTFNLNNITVANGRVAGNGGGIVNSGTLNVTNSILSGNTANSGWASHWQLGHADGDQQHL